MKAPGIALVASLLALSASMPTGAQELEPRAYSPSPVGTNFFAVVLGETRGAILFDPSVPITDAHSDFAAVALGYGRTFALAGRQGLVLATLPYAWGHAEGVVLAGTSLQETRYRRVSGFADMRLKASINLLGPKAMRP